MITALITATTIIRILRIYVERILPPIPSGIINIMVTSSSSSNILLEALAIIRKIGPASTPAVVPVTIGAL